MRGAGGERQRLRGPGGPRDSRPGGQRYNSRRARIWGTHIVVWKAHRDRGTHIMVWKAHRDRGGARHDRDHGWGRGWVGTALLFLGGVGGWPLIEGLLPLFAFLLMLALLIVDALDKGVHHIVEGSARGEGAAVEDVGVGVGIQLRGDAGEDRTLQVIDGEQVARVGGGGRRGELERLRAGCRIGSVDAWRSRGRGRGTCVCGGEGDEDGEGQECRVSVHEHLQLS